MEGQLERIENRILEIEIKSFQPETYNLSTLAD